MLVLLASHIDQIWTHMPQRRAEQMSDYDMQKGIMFYLFNSLWLTLKLLNACDSVVVVSYNYYNCINEHYY